MEAKQFVCIVCNIDSTEVVAHNWNGILRDSEAGALIAWSSHLALRVLSMSCDRNAHMHLVTPLATLRLFIPDRGLQGATNVCGTLSLVD